MAKGPIKINEFMNGLGVYIVHGIHGSAKRLSVKVVVRAGLHRARDVILIESSQVGELFVQLTL